jgi:hypothetical protein
LNDENLIPFTERTEKEQREIARLGGIKSGEARRKKKTMREMVQLIGNAQADTKQKSQLKALLGDSVDDEDITYRMLVAMTLYQKALKEKSMQAIEKIFEIDGQTEIVKNEYQELSVDELRGLLDGTKSSNNPKD